MDGGGRGLEFHPIAAVFSENFRHLQMHFVGGGHDDAIACGPDLLQCPGNPVIFPLDLPQLPEMGHQRSIVANLHACLLAEHLIKQRLRENQTDGHNAAARFDAPNLHFFHSGVFRHLGKQPLGVPKMIRPLG